MDRRLVEALVPEQHRHRYATSPSFRQAIDTLAAMLPAWVDGLAERSDEADRETARAIDAFRYMPGPRWLGPDDLLSERTDP